MPVRSGSVEKGFETSRNCFNLSTVFIAKVLYSPGMCHPLPRTAEPHGAQVPSCHPYLALTFSAKHIGTPGTVP